MTDERRFDRRPPARGGGGGGGDFRPGRGGGPRFGARRSFDERRPSDERRSFDDRPRFPDREGGRRGGPPTDRGRHGGGDDGGMTVRVDPRRLRLLKELAADAGVRPGELVQRWVEERIDAERSGAPASGEVLDTLNATLASIAGRLDALAARVNALERAPVEEAPPTAAEEMPDEPADGSVSPGTAGPAGGATRRRGRPRRSAATALAATPEAAAGAPKVALHEEVIEIIRERGPMRAAELAVAVSERGRYRAPRSSKPLDASTINSRVSNPVYRDRFVRRDGKIGLAGD